MNIKKSILLNYIFTAFLIWYFFIHGNFNYYIKRYIYNQETFYNDIYYQSKREDYLYQNKLLKPFISYKVFLGDSLVERFPVYELFENKNVINRGIGSDTTTGVLNRLESNINNIPIHSCFLLIGHNDFKYRKVEEIFLNFRDILNKIKSKKIFIISLLPCSDSKTNSDIKKLNSCLKFYSIQYGYTYIDVHDFFLDKNNLLLKQYTFDGVHLNIDGYCVLKSLLMRYI
jgi:lysophospholipase L1-like esterase